MNINRKQDLFLTLKTIKAKIRSFNTVILLRHQDPDGDAIGSVLGLGLFLQNHYPNKKIFTDGEATPDYLKFLGSLPLATPTDYQGALLIVCDTANQARIDCSSASKDAAYIIKIDHHPEREIYGDLQLVDPNRVAACELIMELLHSYDCPLPANAARAALTGLITDSNRFLFFKTSQRTFQLVAWITQFIPNVNQIYQHLYLKPMQTLDLIRSLVSKIQIMEAGIAYITVRQAELISWGVDYRQVKEQVNLMAGYKKIKIWFIAVDCDRLHKVKISVRSRGVDCSAAAFKYDGGGHSNAAACWLDSWEQLPAFIEDLLRSINKISKL